MNVEQIVKKSAVTGLMPTRLKGVPLDGVGEILDLFGQLITPIYEEVRVDGVWRIKAVFGHIGLDYLRNEERILWRREFPDPLPLLESRGDYIRNPNGTFGFIFDRKEYLFRKADGGYLSCNLVEGYYKDENYYNV